MLSVYIVPRAHNEICPASTTIAGELLIDAKRAPLISDEFFQKAKKIGVFE
jgi:hypothetical protein